MKIIFMASLLSLFATCCLGMSAEEAVNHPARSQSDRELDSKRKPAEVLTFFHIKPGMRVLDVFGGGGYYAEILSYLVGNSGAVTLYNNNPWNSIVGKDVVKRLKDNRLPNVESLILNPAKLDTVDRQYDAALFILGMHDIYYSDAANGWPEIDRSTFLKNIYRLLAPGATLGIIDHNAAAGTDPTVVGKSLHRIDPKRVIKDLEAVGFRLEEESYILRNPNDSLDISVFDPSIRWQSDRSILTFIK